MPADFVIKTGDQILVTINPPCVVPPLAAPQPLVGSASKVFVLQVPACLEGDELAPTLKAPLPYTSPPFAIPGMGQVELTLGGTNKTSTTKAEGKPLLIKGSPFTAKFSVKAPATFVTPAGVTQTDPMSTYTGTAQFITTNAIVKAG